MLNYPGYLSQERILTYCEENGVTLRNERIEEMIERFKVGDKVHTTQRSPHESGWATGVRQNCRWGVSGFVKAVYTGHGLCYDVTHEDGTTAPYDHDELAEDHVDPQAQAFAKKVMEKPVLAVGNRVMTTLPISSQAAACRAAWPDFLVDNRRWGAKGVVLVKYVDKGVEYGYCVEHEDKSLAFYYREELVAAFEYGLLAATVTDKELGTSMLPQFQAAVVAAARRFVKGEVQLDYLQTAIQAVEMAERLSRSS